MAPALLALLLSATPPQLRDSSTYADQATADLVALARQRHAVQDTLVHDYRALVRTRVDAGFGRSRFARVLPIVAVETAAEVTWARPNDLAIKLVGTRSASRLQGLRAEGTFHRPWFVPRALGDSIRFAEGDLPETAALHPLAPGAEAFYRFAIFDSLTIELPQRSVRAIGVKVEPKRMGPSLVAGHMWVDAETAEVVRLTIVFVGDYLWDRPESNSAADSARALRESARANRILKVEADLQYGLHESRYWMPYQQLVTLTIDVPWFLSARIPVRFLTTFGAYRINAGVAPRFTVALPDSLRRPGRCRSRPADSTCTGPRRDWDRRAREGYARATRWRDGRWELVVPPRDSLLAYQWPDQLSLLPDPAAEQLIRETAASLARVDNSLPAEWVGRSPFGVAYERFSDLVRYNRVQGLSLGAGSRLRVGSAFSSILGSARFGLSDRRPTGSIIWRRDAPGGRLDVGLWRTVREIEPWTSGLSLGNSLNAVVAGHDDADYELGLGGGLAYLGNTALLRDVELGLRVEREASMDRVAHSVVNDWLGGSGQFQPNPGVVPGDYLAGSIAGRQIFDRFELRYGIEGRRGIGGAGAQRLGLRGWLVTRVALPVAGRRGALSLRAAGAVGDSLPQLQVRMGGPETVRGYTYGTRVGRWGWSAQLDFPLARGPVVSPVLFADVGNVAGIGDPLVAAGAGLSFFGGLVRLNLAKGLYPRADVRFDLLFRAPR